MVASSMAATPARSNRVGGFASIRNLAILAAMNAPPNHSQLPLADIRVLDLTRVLAGPYCTMLLADLGADVVKIERPGPGDDARQFGPFLPDGYSAYFASVNRGKRSITLDLKQPADRETFLQLARRADVLVENFRPGAMEHLDLGAARLRELNPRLVFASATGFGHGNNRSHQPAYDVIVQAMSGLMSITGQDAAHTARVGSSISDILTGMFTALGILAALRKRDQQGQGSTLDVAMLDATVAVLENAVSRMDVTQQIPRPIGTRHPSIAPFQAYHAADGPLVIAAGNETLWRKLCELIEAPELLTDPRFASNAARSTNVDLLEQALEAKLKQRTVADWLAVCDAAGIPAAPVRTMADVVADPILAERGMLHTMAAGEVRFITAGSPLRFDGQSLPLSHLAPQLGEHRDEILRDWLGDT